MHNAHGQRRAHKAGESVEPRVERLGDVWRIRSLQAARQILRARHATTQAGFTAEYIPQGVLKHHPILMSDGPLHDEQRSKVGRFFAPKVVRERHGDHICEAAARCIDELEGEVAFDDVTLLYSVKVTSRIVGLTESAVEGRARRLVQFFRQPARHDPPGSGAQPEAVDAGGVARTGAHRPLLLGRRPTSDQPSQTSAAG